MLNKIPYIETCLIFIFGTIPLLAQEQMTFFQGEACCYNTQHLFQYDEHTIAIAKDHQKGVRIYSINEELSTLVFSNHDEDKYTLLSQGLRNDFYYLIYNDELKLFNFDSLQVKTYKFSEPLNDQQAGEGGGLRMTDYGLLLIPDNQGDPLQFFNLKNQKFEQLTNTVKRSDYTVFVDSFMYFTNQQDEFVALLSHNLLTNESQKLYTATSRDFEFQPLTNAFYFRDDHNVYVTKGRVSNTYSLFERKSTHEHIEIFSADSLYAFLTYGDEEIVHYYEYNDEGTLLSENMISFIYDAVITDFRLNGDKEIVFSTALNVLYASAGNRDTIYRVDQFDQYDYSLNAQSIYYVKDNRFWSYNTLNNDRNIISSAHQFGLLYNLLIPSDGLFYWLGKQGAEPVNIMGFHKSQDRFFPVLELGDFNGGAENINIESVGDELFLQGPSIESHVFVDGSFEKVGNVEIISNFIQYDNKYYAIGRDQKFYEWKETLGLIPRITKLPIPINRIGLFVQNNQIIATNYEDFLIEVNVQEQNYEVIKPGQDFKLLERIAANDQYWIYLLSSPTQNKELWSYDIMNRKWTSLLSNGALFAEDLGDVSEVLNDQFVWTEEKVQEFNLKSIHLETAVQELIYRFNYSYRNADLELFSQCKSELILYLYSKQFGVKRLFMTDGTEIGTGLLADSDADWGFQIPYFFDANLYFTEVDSFFTKIYQYDCGGVEMEEQDWSIPLICQGQYSLGSQTFILGNQRHPRQNLTLAERQGDVIIEIAIAPNEFGFFGRDNGQIRSEVPVLVLNDTSMCIVASFDHAGEELWLLKSDRTFSRKTDLNIGPFDAQISELTQYNGYLYFTGYKYGPGMQVWRIPVSEQMTNARKAIKGNSLQIMPNPSKGRFRLLNLPKERAVLNVINSAGKIIHQIKKEALETELSVDIQKAPTGIYFLKLVGAQNIYTANLMLLH